MTRATAYDRHPDHTLHFDDQPASLRVSLGDRVIADTRRGLNLREGRYPAVVYVPREDVQMSALERGNHTTHCPFKGDATYFDFRDEERAIAEIAWSYEDPYEQMHAIRGHLAFYPDRVTLTPLED